MKKLDIEDIQKKIMSIGLNTGCGHIASAMSCSKVLVETYNGDPEGIIILSKGHGALAQYVILNTLGKISDKELGTYYQNGGLGGHTTLNIKKGIYASTGSLGHGLAIGIGYAIANPKKKVYVILSDGECQEGSTLESFLIIKRLKIKNIVPVIDVNGWQGFEANDNRYLPRHQIDAFHYYSQKGEGFGGLQDTLESHYTRITQEIYDNWTKFINSKNERNN